MPAVTVDQQGIQPDDITKLHDDSSLTCATFTASKTQQTKIYEPSTCSAGQLTITVVGNNLDCSRLYVVGMTTPGEGARRDRWAKCTLTWQTIDQNSAEWCSFACLCTGGCQQVMVAKWPKTMAESSWTLCAIRQNCVGRLMYYENSLLWSEHSMVKDIGLDNMLKFTVNSLLICVVWCSIQCRVLVLNFVITATHCLDAPCYHGGTCVNAGCLCPAFCMGTYCENCVKDPYPPEVPITIGSVTFNTVEEDGYIVSNCTWKWPLITTRT
jgi:hypothetical protein